MTLTTSALILFALLWIVAGVASVQFDHKEVELLKRRGLVRAFETSYFEYLILICLGAISLLYAYLSYKELKGRNNE